MDTDNGVGLTMGAGGEFSGGGRSGGNGDNCNRITIKKEYILH